MAVKSSEFDHQMAQLEAELKRLEAEYNMFFAGRLPRLPWETRARVDALVKRYDRMNLRNTAEKFRFGTLQARYVAFCDLWDRSLKAREEGRPKRGRRTGAHAEPASTPGKVAAKPDADGRPSAKIVAVAAFRDPAAQGDLLADLYDRLSAARKDVGEKPVPFEAFKQVVRAQVTKLGGGGNEVAFRVAVEGGKVTLTAKALKGAE
jgi:hypothetical protein